MITLRLLSFAASLLLATPLVTLQAQATFLEYRTTVPTGWVAATPSSSMRLAEYRVPAATGTIPVEIVVYSFGPGQGGSPQANLARWKSQFSNPTGGPVAEAPRGTLFFQCFGPAAAVDAQRAVYLKFVRGLR